MVGTVKLDVDDLEKLVGTLRRLGVLEYRDQEVSIILGAPPLEPATLGVEPDDAKEEEGSW